MSIVLRYVQQSVYKRFIGFVHVSQLDAESLCKYICDTLASFDMSLANCVSQSYDGASVMSGNCTGVQSHIKEPQAVYIHCHAHRLNLVLVDCVKTVSIAGKFLASLESIYVFVSTSKADEFFCKWNCILIQLKRLIESRWARRHLCIRAVRETYGSVLATLHTIAPVKDQDSCTGTRVLAYSGEYSVYCVSSCV